MDSDGHIHELKKNLSQKNLSQKTHNQGNQAMRHLIGAIVLSAESCQLKRKTSCCCAAKMPCITMQPLFAQLVLDGNVLDIALRLWEDVLVYENHRNNENFRHAAYRQFVLWQNGRLGKGNRRVIPSCCVLAICSRYPSPNGFYVGYRPSRL